MVDGYCIGYKVLSFRNDSPFKGFVYKEGINVSSTNIFDERCLNNHPVHFGLHIFLNYKDALKDKQRNNKIVKVFFKKEDVVAYGDFVTYPLFNAMSKPSTNQYDMNNFISQSSRGKSAVVKKLIVKSLEPI